MGEGLEAATGRDGRIGVLMLDTQRGMFAPQYVHAALLRLLDRRRFRPFVAVSTESEGRAVWERALGAPAWVLPLGTSVSIPRGLAARAAALLTNARLLPGLLRLAARVRRERIEVIHTEMKPRDALGGMVLSLLTGAAHVPHWHTLNWGWYPLVWRLAFRRARAILAVSEASRRVLLEMGVPEGKIHVLYNGIDTGRFHPGADGAAVRRELGIPDGEAVVLLLGRLVPGKGQHDLLRAVAALRERGREVTVLLVGNEDPMATPGRGNYRAELERLRDDLGLGDRVRFVGHREDTPAVMCAADIVTLPSYEESFGLVVAEAMACGQAVIGTRIGGIPELIVDGETGLLIDAGDPAGLAAALERLLADPEYRRLLGRNARERIATRFSQERAAQDLGHFYESLVGGGRATGRSRAAVQA